VHYDIIVNICIKYGAIVNLNEIGSVISEQRKLNKLTQSELAKNIGTSRSRISELEQGIIQEIGIRKVIAMCEILGLEMKVVKKNKRPTLEQLVEDNKNA
jgi:HTH-type transcriptional regulator/antitoxin HipB